MRWVVGVRAWIAYARLLVDAEPRSSGQRTLGTATRRTKLEELIMPLLLLAHTSMQKMEERWKF